MKFFSIQIAFLTRASNPARRNHNNVAIDENIHQTWEFCLLGRFSVALLSLLVEAMAGFHVGQREFLRRQWSLPPVTHLIIDRRTIRKAYLRWASKRDIRE
jgi:hypothetical protein